MTIIQKPNFKNHLYQTETILVLQNALSYFPEIQQIKIGCIGHKGGYKLTNGIACYKDMSVSFPFHKIPSYITIFHELGHILQFLRVAPSGEQQASIYGLSRIPISLCDGDYIPYLGRIPRELIPSFCASVLAQKASGTAHYLQWAETELQKIRTERSITPNLSPEELLLIYA